MVEINEVQDKWTHKIPGKEIIETWKRVRIRSAGDRLYSYHLGMKTILDIVAMPEYPGTAGVFLTKWLYNPGQYDNYASLWAWKSTTEHEDTIGSVWCNVHGLGQ